MSDGNLHLPHYIQIPVEGNIDNQKIMEVNSSLLPLHLHNMMILSHAHHADLMRDSTAHKKELTFAEERVELQKYSELNAWHYWI